MAKDIGPNERRLREMREQRVAERGGKTASLTELRAVVAKAEKRKPKTKTRKR